MTSKIARSLKVSPRELSWLLTVQPWNTAEVLRILDTVRRDIWVCRAFWKQNKETVKVTKIYATSFDDLPFGMLETKCISSVFF